MLQSFCTIQSEIINLTKVLLRTRYIANKLKMYNWIENKIIRTSNWHTERTQFTVHPDLIDYKEIHSTDRLIYFIRYWVASDEKWTVPLVTQVVLHRIFVENVWNKEHSVNDMIICTDTSAKVFRVEIHLQIAILSFRWRDVLFSTQENQIPYSLCSWLI